MLRPPIATRRRSEKLRRAGLALGLRAKGTRGGPGVTPAWCLRRVLGSALRALALDPRHDRLASFLGGLSRGPGRRGHAAGSGSGRSDRLARGREGGVSLPARRGLLAGRLGPRAVATS